MPRGARVEGMAGPPKFHAALTTIPDIAAEVRRRGGRYEHELLVRDLVSGRALGDDLEMDGPALILRSVHRMEGRAFLEERFISLQAVPEAQHADFAETAPSSWLLAHVPWTQAEHRIGVTNADPWTARMLAIGLTDACLIVERRTWRGQEPISLAILTFPGEDFELLARFRPQPRPALTLSAPYTSPPTRAPGRTTAIGAFDA